jgi:methionyl aminopeptidase
MSFVFCLKYYTMIYYKTEKDIQAIKESALILGKAHAEVAKAIKPGISTKDLDKIAEQFIKDHGAKPSFLNYNGFPASLCISVNECVVHGIPNKYILKDGDIISVDCGVYLNGYHSDSAYTYPVGEVLPEVKALLKATKESLYKGIEQAKLGNRIGDIGFAIQSYVEEKGYSVVRELVGHGLGRALHEKPEVPNYGLRGKGTKIQNGLVIAIEPMINMGRREVVQENDGWTIRTRDNKPSAHFEHTVAIHDGQTEILTTFEYIEQVFKF